MSTQHLNIYARDSRISGSLTGLGYSTLETLERLYSSQIKIIGTNPMPPVPVYSYRISRKTCSSRASVAYPYWWRVSGERVSVRNRFKCSEFTARCFRSSYD